MPDRRSALAAVYRTGRYGAGERDVGVVVRERIGRTLVQISGSPGAFGSVCRALEDRIGCGIPQRCSAAASRDAISIFRVSPERLWVAGPTNDGTLRDLDAATLSSGAVVCEIGHSRTVVRVTGACAQELLNRGLPVDLDALVFPVDAVAQSVIHQMPVLVHRAALADGHCFDVYVTSDYAVSFWEWLTEAAQGFGCQVEVPE